ncbi:hypothetical protein E3G52_005243 [Mycobacteroides abscessus]|uniref:type II toxin-antitoxin system RelE/ParE family toxin n=1 Tax=Mycobacteroides abscessus TaxID=36809 RepID=UPI00187830E2|nr:type II toxin-antitoxin system RelE/ParE family toxin [Mycobacteroides abscessus]MBE5458335.1 hypothetical protein [Mycobacteroides abscessus]
MIRSFLDKDTEAVWERRFVKRFGPELSKAAYRKLVVLHAAGTLNDLRVPPGNRLEKLVGDRSGQHSIRINDQWRICFTWNDTNADDVEIADYH